jgi:hypothetical protein
MEIFLAMDVFLEVLTGRGLVRTTLSLANFERGASDLESRSGTLDSEEASDMNAFAVFPSLGGGAAEGGRATRDGLNKEAGDAGRGQNMEYIGGGEADEVVRIFLLREGLG